MSDVRHERHFGDFRGTSAYPPRLAVKADIPDRPVCATTGREHMQRTIRAVEARSSWMPEGDKVLSSSGSGSIFG